VMPNIAKTRPNDPSIAAANKAGPIRPPGVTDGNGVGVGIGVDVNVDAAAAAAAAAAAVAAAAAAAAGTLEVAQVIVAVVVWNCASCEQCGMNNSAFTIMDTHKCKICGKRVHGIL